MYPDFYPITNETTRFLSILKLRDKVLLTGDVIAIKWPNGCVTQHRLEVFLEEQDNKITFYVEHNGTLLTCVLQSGMMARIIKSAE
jgi:hypothetical protein